MTNKEAVEVLQSMKSDFPLPKAAQTRRAQNDALDVAIEALKAEPCENAMLKEIATELVKEIKEDLIITDFSGNTRTITATKAAPNVPCAPPVYAVSADDVIENMESELELCNKVLDDVNVVGTAHMIYDRVAEMLREQIDFVKGLPQVEPEPRKGKCLPPAQPEQRWIPVTERPPKKGQKCLVSDKGCIAIDTFWGRGGAYNWQFYVRDYEAWMPLVEPYNAKRRNESDGRD